ncbi:MAG: hypothetical protein GXO87_13500 [Chlorobi bacterium]|nr:hypothetical protein [Chlorobiota bacterium]
MKNIINSLFILIFVSLLFFAVSCDSTAPNDNEIPASNVSYSQHIQPVLNVKCAISGCHDDATASGGYIMTSYTNVFRIPLVIPNEPNASHIYLAVTAQGGLTPMPPIYASVPPMTDKEIQGLKTWIEEGAKNN